MTIGARFSSHPVSMVIFAGFIVYQLYRYSFTHGVGLLALSASISL